MIRQLILLFFAFFLLAAVAIAAIWTQIIPEYRAEAEIRIRPIIPYLVFRTEDSGMIPLYESFVYTQVSIMRGSTVLQRVLDQREIQETQWYNEPPKPLIQRLLGKQTTSPVERLKDGLSAKPRSKSEIIDVIFTDSNAEDARIIVDVVLDQYMQYIGEKSDATKDELYKKLVDQYKSLDNEIKGQEMISAELRRSLGTGTPQELVSTERIRLNEMQARLSEKHQSIAVLEWERNQLEDLMKRDITPERKDVLVDSTIQMEKKPKYHEDSEWRALDINVRTSKHSIATSELEPNNPEIIKATKDMEFAKELLQLREAQLDEQWHDRPQNASEVPVTITSDNGPDYEEELRTLERQLARTKYEEQLLLPEFKKQQADFQRLFETVQLLEKENNALQHKRELFGAVRQRLDQKSMERNVPGSIEVLTRAFASSEPYKDRRILYTAIVLILDGLGIILSGCLLHRHGYL
ncbi:MAG: GumC domain-containing protein [Planctomycetota bacterium]|jgi:uncharacterized protein involved in exopolysaccharide biosynthesis